MKEKWFVVTIILECRIEGDESSVKTYEENIHVIRAIDEEHAYDKALKLGNQKEITYTNAYNQTVFWKFVGLGDLEELPFDKAIRDGTEIRSRFFKRQDSTGLAKAKSSLSIFPLLPLTDQDQGNEK